MAEDIRAGTHLEVWRERIPDCRRCNAETETYYIDTSSHDFLSFFFLLGDCAYANSSQLITQKSAFILPKPDIKTLLGSHTLQVEHMLL